MGNVNTINSAGEAVVLPLDDLEIVFTYTGTLIETASVVYRGETYTQTFTYTDGLLTTVSRWIVQE
jgi:hypothetical protein